MPPSGVRRSMTRFASAATALVASQSATPKTMRSTIVDVMRLLDARTSAFISIVSSSAYHPREGLPAVLQRRRDLRHVVIEQAEIVLGMRRAADTCREHD